MVEQVSRRDVGDHVREAERCRGTDEADGADDQADLELLDLEHVLDGGADPGPGALQGATCGGIGWPRGLVRRNGDSRCAGPAAQLRSGLSHILPSCARFFQMSECG